MLSIIKYYYQGLPVKRPATVEQSVWGVALLAGLQVGL